MERVKEMVKVVAWNIRKTNKITNFGWWVTSL